MYLEDINLQYTGWPIKIVLNFQFFLILSWFRWYMQILSNEKKIGSWEQFLCVTLYVCYGRGAHTQRIELPPPPQYPYVEWKLSYEETLIHNMYIHESFSIFFFNSEESCSSYRILIFEILSEQKKSPPGTFVKDIFWSDDFLTMWFVVSPLKKRYLFFQTMCKKMSTGDKNLHLLKHSYKKKAAPGERQLPPDASWPKSIS